VDLRDKPQSYLDANGQQTQQHMSEQNSPNYLMEQYFNLVNTHMHGQPGGIVESESFTPDFRLPTCYDIPKFREAASGTEVKELIPPARCQQFPDKVLFYIFYSMPHDRAQLSAGQELKSRKWLYCNASMRWLKANTQASPPNQSSKKDQKAAGKKGGSYQKAGNKAADKSSESVGAANNRTVIVFNPLLWKEEIVNLVED